VDNACRNKQRNKEKTRRAETVYTEYLLRTIYYLKLSKEAQISGDYIISRPK
jgi:hypothetical protein